MFKDPLNPWCCRQQLISLQEIYIMYVLILISLQEIIMYVLISYLAYIT